jgi:tetratricopeptide (TPR) repeat protein
MRKDPGTHRFHESDNIDELDARIAKNPDFGLAWAARARYYERQKDHEKAIADWSAALALYRPPWRITVYPKPGHLDHGLKQRLEHNNDLTRAAMMESRGDDFVKIKDYGRAVRDYAVSLAVNPERKGRGKKLEKARAHLADGEARWEEGDTKGSNTFDFQQTEILQSLDYVIEKAAERGDPDLHQYYYLRGVTHAKDEGGETGRAGKR